MGFFSPLYKGEEMKRSEMIQKFDECYEQWVEDWLAANINELEGFVGLSDRLLKVCEDAGMNPPECQRKLTKEELEGFNKLFKGCKTGLLDEDDTITDFCWEDEDE